MLSHVDLPIFVTQFIKAWLNAVVKYKFPLGETRLTNPKKLFVPAKYKKSPICKIKLSQK